MHRRHDRCPLDPEPPYQAPEQWDAPHVQHRFADAIGTLTRLPLGRIYPANIYTCWPACLSDYDAMMARCAPQIEAMAEEGTLSLEYALEYHEWIEDRHRLRDPPTAVEISHMERALFWPGRCLRGQLDQVRALNLTALARVRGVSVGDVVRCGKHVGVKSPAPWQALALEAAHRIAVGLRTDGIAVF